jgi:hypothetical protein
MPAWRETSAPASFFLCCFRNPWSDRSASESSNRQERIQSRPARGFQTAQTSLFSAALTTAFRSGRPWLRSERTTRPARNPTSDHVATPQTPTLLAASRPQAWEALRASPLAECTRGPSKRGAPLPGLCWRARSAQGAAHAMPRSVSAFRFAREYCGRTKFRREKLKSDHQTLARPGLQRHMQVRCLLSTSGA